MKEAGLDIHQLQQEVGVPIRTIHHWVKEKLLPKPSARGRTATYTQGHVLRAKVIRQLRQSKLSLREIHKRIAPLGDEQLSALLAQLTRPPASEGVPLPPPPINYPFKNWELVQIMKGLFLMVDPAQGPAVRRIANEIYQHFSHSSNAG